ncbi:unnamed protein product [Orchesella dallaii]|uniref:BHLH domain-containing protein n=1 Tax=Orchesella dallaii TaxID=48710 RepID=A0ABP1QZD4_9HEXA
MKVEGMDTLTLGNQALVFGNAANQQQFHSVKHENVLSGSSSTDEMMMDLFNGSDIDLLEDILSMEELFPAESQMAPPQPQQVASPRQPQQLQMRTLACSPPSNQLFPQANWTELEPTLLSPESVKSVNSPPPQQLPLQPKPALQHIAPAPSPVISTQSSVVVQQANNVTTTTSPIINPFANVFINQHGTVVASQQQNQFIPTSAYNGVFPVILPQLLTVVDGKLPVPASKPSISSSGGSSSKRDKKKKNQESNLIPQTHNRRSSHNAIERRYRSSINDKILELKSLVISHSDPNEKVHKAAILRSSIETIKLLQSSNNRLEKENKMLRSRKCGVCGAEQETNASENLRELLINSPPISEHSNSSESGCSSGSSSPIGSPAEKRIGSGGSAAAPLVLFAVACGLFLINPGSETHHVVKREVVDALPQPHWFASYVPRITAMGLNLIVFLFLYKILGIFTSEKQEEKQEVLIHEPPSSFKRFVNYKEFLYTFLWSGKENKAVATAYMNGSKRAVDSLSREWYGYKIIQNSLSVNSQDLLVSGLILVNSKILVKRCYSRLKALSEKQDFSLHPLFDFGIHHIVNSTYSSTNAFTTEIPNGLLSNVMQGLKHECILKGITRLLVNGDKSTCTYFKNCLRVVVSEGKNPGIRDQLAEWWGCLLWVEAEWMANKRSGRTEPIEKLVKVVDSLWKRKIQGSKLETEQPVFKAVYYAHRVRREIIMVRTDFCFKSSIFVI